MNLRQASKILRIEFPDDYTICHICYLPRDYFKTFTVTLLFNPFIHRFQKGFALESPVKGFEILLTINRLLPDGGRAISLTGSTNIFRSAAPLSCSFSSTRVTVSWENPSFGTKRKMMMSGSS